MKKNVERALLVAIYGEEYASKWDWVSFYGAEENTYEFENSLVNEVYGMYVTASRHEETFQDAVEDFKNGKNSQDDLEWVVRSYRAFQEAEWLAFMMS